MVGGLQGRAAYTARTVHRFLPSFIRFVFFVCAAFVPAAAHVSGISVGTNAGAAGASASDVGPAIWFADHHSAHRIPVAAHLVDHVIPLAHEATALAIDPRDRSLWVLSHKHLQKFDAQTSLVHDIDLNRLVLRAHEHRGKHRKDKYEKIEDPRGLVLSPNDGSVWFRGEKAVIRVSDVGQYLSSWSSEEKIESFALSLDGSLFVLTRKRLVRLSGDAEELASHRLGSRGVRIYRHLAVDALGGVVWLADKEVLQQHSLTSLGTGMTLRAYPVKRDDEPRRGSDDDDRRGHRAHEHRHGHIEALALDPLTGTVWLARERSVHVFGRDGALIATVDLAAQGIHRIDALAFDALSRHLFVGGKRTIVQLGVDAHVVAQIELDRELEALGVSPLALAPRLRLLQPGEGTLTNNAKLPLRFEWGAECNGVSCDAGQAYGDAFTLDVMLNGQPIGAQFIHLPNEAVYAPAERYPEGVNMFEAQAWDTFGRPSAPIAGHFVVDTIPPAFQSLTPDDGSAVATAEAMLEGRLDDATAAIALENLTAIGGTMVRDDPLGFAFKVPLSPGANAFTLIATDAAGNQARKTINVTRTAGVSVRVDSVADGDAVGTDRILIMGTFEGPLNTGITVNGQIAQIHGQRLFANNVALQPGANNIAVVATTLDGVVREQTLTIASTVPAKFTVERAPAFVSIRTIGGTGEKGFAGDGGPAVQARLWYPSGIAVAPDGSVYFSDGNNNRIRRIRPDGIIETVVGSGAYGAGGDFGPATQAQLDTPLAIAFGPDGVLYIADTFNQRIRKVDLDGIITTVAGTGMYADTGDGGLATQATFRYPSDIVVAPDGAVFVADADSHRIRRIAPDGRIDTIAGTGEYGFSGDGGPATAASLAYPYGVALGKDGSIYVSDSDNYRIRRIAPNGTIDTIAGSGEYGDGGDGGPATQAQFGWVITGVAVGEDGAIYISDSDHNRIRRVGSDGIVTTVAGTGAYGDGGDGGAPTGAQMAYPWGVAIGTGGDMYIADTDNHRVRAFTTLNTNGNTAPLLVGFRLDSHTAAQAQHIEADYDGDGAADLVTTDSAALLQHRYANSGAYVARFTVTDTDGLTHALDYAVVLPDVAHTDTMLRGIYTGMLGSLKAQDIDAALKAVTGGAYEKYQSVFTALQADLPQIVGQLGELQGGMIGEEVAEYVLVREVEGNKRAFLLYFLRSEDGVWRIDGM